MEKYDHKKRDATENFFVVTDHVSPLQKQLLDQKILLSNMSADSTDQAELEREIQVLHILEHLVEAEKQQQPHYSVSRLVAADVAPGNILSLEGKAEVGDNQPNTLIALSCYLNRVFDLSTPFADLLEERTSKAAEAGVLTAQWWYLRQVLKSVPPMFLRIGRNSVKHLPRGIFKGLGGSIVKTTIIDVLATLMSAILLQLIRQIMR